MSDSEDDEDDDEDNEGEKEDDEGEGEEEEEEENFNVGDKIRNVYNLRGIVTSVNLDGTYDVKYNDNRTDSNVKSRMLKTLPGKSYSSFTFAFDLLFSLIHNIKLYCIQLLGKGVLLVMVGIWFRPLIHGMTQERSAVGMLLLESVVIELVAAKSSRACRRQCRVSMIICPRLHLIYYLIYKIHYAYYVYSCSVGDSSAR